MNSIGTDRPRISRNLKREDALGGGWKDRLLGGLTLLLLAATGALLVAFVIIAANPTVPFNPYPPATPLPSPTSLQVLTRMSRHIAPTATPVPLPNPTPLKPATLTPTPEPTMPFSATVRSGPLSPFLDCSHPLLAGTVTDREGEDLVGYPVHVWGPETDLVILSGSAPLYGPSGWEVTEITAGKNVSWYLQLHLYAIFRAHPPLSEIVHIEVPVTCPQAMVYFQERP